MSKDGLEIIGDKRTLQEVAGIGMLSIIRFQLPDDAGQEQDVGVTAEDGLALSLAEDAVARGGGANGIGGQDVASLGPPLDEGPRVLTAVIVDHEQFDVVQILVPTQRL